MAIPSIEPVRLPPHLAARADVFDGPVNPGLLTALEAVTLRNEFGILDTFLFTVQ
jgi:hypothetical protein